MPAICWSEVLVNGLRPSGRPRDPIFGAAGLHPLDGHNLGFVGALLLVFAILVSELAASRIALRNAVPSNILSMKKGARTLLRH